MTNKAYYKAEAALIDIINNCSHEELLEKLNTFILRAQPDSNRELFNLFAIKEV